LGIGVWLHHYPEVKVASMAADIRKVRDSMCAMKSGSVRFSLGWVEFLASALSPEKKREGRGARFCG